MFKKRKPQPKDAFEHPESNEELLEEQPAKDEEELPLSAFTGEPFDPEWAVRLHGRRRRSAPDPSIISKVWR